MGADAAWLLVSLWFASPAEPRRPLASDHFALTLSLGESHGTTQHRTPCRRDYRAGHAVQPKRKRPLDFSRSRLFVGLRLVSEAARETRK